MLQNIREGIQGPWAIGIVALIVVSFVFTGVGSYISSSGSDAVAIVNDKEISVNTLNNAYDNERARLESQFGEAVNSLFASETYINQFRSDVLERLINDELVAQKSAELGLRVGDEQVKQAIATMPEFQIAGQFNNENYLNALARAGYTPSDFAELIREQMTQQQLAQSLNGSSFSLDYQAKMFLALQQQERSGQSIEIDIEKYKDTVDVSEEEINTFYNDNLSSFDTEERVKLAYVSLSVADLESKVSVSEDETLQYYQDNIAFYTNQEEREISHILFEFFDEGVEARSEAELVLSKLEQGESFAELAAEYSDDIVSAENGGDLGVINEGDYSEEFDAAAFALTQEGDVSGIVQTEFGYHIIKLTKLRQETVQEFADVQDEIKAELKTSKATDEYFALQSEMARIAFEEPDSLQTVSEAVGRPIIETDYFSPQQLPAGVNYPQVADIAFSSELIDDQVNSDLLELSNELVMVVRAADYEPQRTRSLDEVKEQIVARLKVDKAQEQALAYAQDIQTAIFEGKELDSLLAQHSLSWSDFENIGRRANSLPFKMTEALFSLSPNASENTSVVTLDNGNIGLVKLSSVKTVDNFDESLIADTLQQLRSSESQQTYQNFVEALRESSSIQYVANQ